jgi:type I restriction-modification system DNA methylase subunit
MIKLFKELSYRNQLWEVYSDFLQLSALAISNAVDYINYKPREEKYKSLIQKYSEKERYLFPKLLAELAQSLTENVSDVLGELYMELELGSSWKGQFFTPYNLCLLMAEISLENIDTVVKEKGFIELNEPSCGGGALVIATSEVIKKKGYNPQQILKVICQDLDLKSVYMSYIQLSLLGIPAQVLHANTLSLEVFDVYKTPAWILGGWSFRNSKVGK